VGAPLGVLGHSVRVTHWCALPSPHFPAARDELDPRRTFTNSYAERVLGA